MNEKKRTKPNRLCRILYCSGSNHDLCNNGECRALELWTFFIFVIALCAFATFHELTAIGD